MAATKKILVVDDDLTAVQATMGTLRKHGYEVVIAQDGASAMMVMQRENPDLVVLDIGLPAGDGFRVMHNLKSNPRFIAIPIIVVSGKDPAQCVDRAITEGAVAYFEKPADMQELCDAIGDCLAQGAPPQG